MTAPEPAGAGSAGGPDQARPGRRRPVALAAAVALFVMAAVSALGLPLSGLLPAQAQDTDAQPIRVTRVDATQDQVELAVIGAPLDATADDITLASDDSTIGVSGVSTAAASERRRELVVVVDTNARGIDDSVLDTIKAQLTGMAQGLPPQLSVAVISAGDTALVRTTMTGDPVKLTAAVDGLVPKNGAALLNAVHRGSNLFSRDTDVIRTMLVVSTGADLGSDISLAKARVPLVANGIQVVSLRYQAGEPELASLADSTFGVDSQVGSAADLGPALAGALATATDRLLVTFTGQAESGTRSNLHLAISGSAVDLSYPSGVVTTSPLQLKVERHTDPTGFAFFRSSIGMYLSLVLAFVGIALAVWSLSSIMFAGDTTLEGLLSRYADGRGDVDESDVEELIVQSALLKRAINFSESFAEKRGFLVRVEDLLEKANMPIRAGEAMFALAAITVFSSIFGLLLTRSIVAAVLIGVFAVGTSFFVVKFLARRRFKQFESLLPDTLQLLSGTLRAGYSLPQGMEVVSREIADPMGQELRRAMTEARLGRELEECLAGVSERMTSADFAWAVMAIGIQREVGGNLNELLNSVADTMIARERLRREVAALTAEGKMSAGILSFLPPGLGLVMWVMNPAYIALLFTSFLGNVLLGLGTVSASVGLAWMKKVITIDV